MLLTDLFNFESIYSHNGADQIEVVGQNTHPSFTSISLFLFLIVTPLTSFSLFSRELRFKAEMIDNMLMIILLLSLSYLIILLFLGGVLNMSTHALRWTTM